MQSASPDRCLQVAKLLHCGLSNKEIAAQLQISIWTVKGATHRLCDEFGITGGMKRVKLVVKLNQYPIFTELFLLPRSRNHRIRIPPV